MSEPEVEQPIQVVCPRCGDFIPEARAVPIWIGISLCEACASRLIGPEYVEEHRSRPELGITLKSGSASWLIIILLELMLVPLAFLFFWANAYFEGVCAVVGIFVLPMAARGNAGFREVHFANGGIQLVRRGGQQVSVAPGQLTNWVFFLGDPRSPARKLEMSLTVARRGFAKFLGGDQTLRFSGPIRTLTSLKATFDLGKELGLFKGIGSKGARR